MGVFAELKGAWRVYRDRGKSLADTEAPETKLVHIDSQGNRWYTLVDPLKIPAERAISALVAMRRNELNYTEKDERVWVDAAIAAHNAHEHAQVGYYLTVKKDRLDWACEDKTLLELAKAYFWINEEPAAGPMLPKWQEQKEAAWASDANARAFFLREAFWHINGFSELSLSDIPNYLEARAKKIQTESKPKPSARRGAKRAASLKPGK